MSTQWVPTTYVFMENWRNRSLNYHQIPSFSVPLILSASLRGITLWQNDTAHYSNLFGWQKNCGILQYYNKLNLRTTKTAKWPVRPSKTQSAWASAKADQSLRCPREDRLGLSYPLSAQRRLWSDWALTRLIWVVAGCTGHFVGFVEHRLNYLYYSRERRSYSQTTNYNGW